MSKALARASATTVNMMLEMATLLLPHTSNVERPTMDKRAPTSPRAERICPPVAVHRVAASPLRLRAMNWDTDQSGVGFGTGTGSTITNASLRVRMATRTPTAPAGTSVSARGRTIFAVHRIHHHLRLLSLGSKATVCTFQKEWHMRDEGTIKRHGHLRTREVLGETFTARTVFGNGAESSTIYGDLGTRSRLSIADVIRVEIIVNGHGLTVRDGITIAEGKELC